MAAPLLSLVAVLVLARIGMGAHARARAERTGRSIAAYLEILALRSGPPVGETSRLLVHSRALVTLPGFAEGIEVYHGTAPLIRATGEPLPAAVYEQLRRGTAGRWWRGGALLPLRRPSDSAVVGAVLVSPRPDRRASARLLIPMLAGVALVTWWRARGAAVPGALGAYAVAAAALGVAAALDVRRAGREALESWMRDARSLVQDAVARSPGGRIPLAELARLAPGATLTPGREGPAMPRHLRGAGADTVVLAVRLSDRRWLELRVAAADAAGELGLALVLLAAALGGPAALALGRYRTGPAPSVGDSREERGRVAANAERDMFRVPSEGGP